uniref:Uncharacterized protein n=1 Tax=Plectus sambesii TaxID=2011161 RepID=A0A914X8E1_9BILA
MYKNYPPLLLIDRGYPSSPNYYLYPPRLHLSATSTAPPQVLILISPSLSTVTIGRQARRVSGSRSAVISRLPMETRPMRGATEGATSVSVSFRLSHSNYLGVAHPPRIPPSLTCYTSGLRPDTLRQKGAYVSH